MKNHLHNDTWLSRIIMFVLDITVVTSMIAAILLVLSGQSMLEVMVALGSAAVAGLAGFLAPSLLNR